MNPRRAPTLQKMKELKAALNRVLDQRVFAQVLDPNERAHSTLHHTNSSQQRGLHHSEGQNAAARIRANMQSQGRSLDIMLQEKCRRQPLACTKAGVSVVALRHMELVNDCPRGDSIGP